MSTIDKQRIAAVRKLEGLGYTFTGDEWTDPANNTVGPTRLAADALFALSVKRADDLAGCTEGSEQEHELAAITDAIEAYVAVRWPHGQASDGKGACIDKTAPAQPIIGCNVATIERHAQELFRPETVAVPDGRTDDGKG
jgi:hypothetical protein